jgi:glycosyltransferase involved in cell wall biosynthesis
MIAVPSEASAALNTGAAGFNPQSVRPRRRTPVPRAVIFHGTTCIHQNQSASMANRDINTILIGRYMLERSNLNGGYNLDEYAVMHCAARMDEIWVPTEWHRRVFERLFAQQGSASSMPLIAVIPEAVDTTLFDPHYTHKASTRSIVGEDRVYVADATRLAEEQVLTDTNRVAVRTECSVTEDSVRCADGQKFEFLSIFKWEYRKGWDVMLGAYWAAFKPTDDVVLRVRSYVPHTSAGDRNITRVIETYAQRTQGKPLAELARVVWENGVEGFTIPYPRTPAPEIIPTPGVSSEIEPAAGQQPSPSVAADVAAGGEAAVDSDVSGSSAAEDEPQLEPETHLTREDMRALLASANAFVLATRGEGWGLPIAEAMAMALPVIVTNHSGPAAFADTNNAYLVNVQPELDEFSFAKPIQADLVTHMRQVIADSSSAGGYVAQGKGLRAREKMKEISADSIVCKMNERLRFHAMRRGWDLP